MSIYKELSIYKEMYWKMYYATEQAIHLLVAAQQECENLYISHPEENIVPFSSDYQKGTNEE